MAEYYKNRPSVVAVRNVAEDGVASASTHGSTLSEFDRHRETLLIDDAEESCASELRRYLKSMQRDVKKDTDIVEWWQVSSLRVEAFYLPN